MWEIFGLVSLVADNSDAAASAAVGAMSFLFFLPFILFWIVWVGMFLVMIGGMILWILMIIDIAKRDFAKSDDRTMWILIVVLAGFVGAIVYYFVVVRGDNNSKLKTHNSKFKSAS
jgi:hypothetical protein